eukprot:332848_1
MYYFEEIEDALYGHFVHYLKTNNSVLIIPDKCSYIYLYSLSTNKCDILAMNTSNSVSCGILPISYPSCVLSRNEHYLIAFSYFNTDVRSDVHTDIFLFDLKIRKTWKSNIENNEGTEVTIRSDMKKEELLCFGYLRQCWNSQEFLNIRFLSNDLIQCMNAYFSIEIIHIMNPTDHLCINIDNFIETHDEEM